MGYITCEVTAIENEEEVTVGHIHVLNVPRVGEYIWFAKPRRGHRSWLVTEVAHWVGDGEFLSIPYQNVAIYAQPTKEVNEEKQTKEFQKDQ